MTTIAELNPELTDADVAFIEGMKAAVEERGEDWKYPSPEAEDADQWYNQPEAYSTPACQYSKPDGTPACIVGLALSKAGLTVPKYGDTYGAEELNYSADSDDRPFLAPPVLRAAADAQNEQDKGRTWGEAYRTFVAGLEARGVQVPAAVAA